MTANISTAISRELGTELRRLREGTTHHSARSLSGALGWDTSKVCKIENGWVRASELDLMQYLSLCGLNREQIDDFYRDYRDAFEPYQLRLPNLRTLAVAESTATKIVSYDPVVIPGLLQLESYARALFYKMGLATPETIELGVTARMERQAVLRRINRPECIFYIHENALRTKVGDAEVMVDQVAKLMRQTTYVVRIVADAAWGSAYKLLQYEKYSPIAYSENELGSVFAQDTATIARTKLIFERVEECALDEAESIAVLMKYVDVYDQQRRGLA